MDGNWLQRTLHWYWLTGPQVGVILAGMLLTYVVVFCWLDRRP